MAESNGLLDLMKSPAAMGLLAAGFGGLAGANRNTPYNNLGRAGLAGLAGYSATEALQQQQAKLAQEAADNARKTAMQDNFLNRIYGNNLPSTGQDGQPSGAQGLPAVGSASPQNSVQPTGGTQGLDQRDIMAASVLGIPGISTVADMWKYNNTPQERKQGTTYVDPVSGTEKYMPKLPEGTYMDNGVIRLIPGYTGAIGATAGATSGAQAAATFPYQVGLQNNQIRQTANYDLVPSIDPVTGNTTSITRSQAVGAANPQMHMGQAGVGGQSGGVGQSGGNGQSNTYQTGITQGAGQGLPSSPVVSAVNPVVQKAKEAVNTDYMTNSYRPVIEAATGASDTNNSIQAMRTIDLNTGWGTQAKASAASFLVGLGVPSDTAKLYATKSQQFQSIAMDRLQKSLMQQKGPQTEGDAQRASDTFAQLSNTPEANKFILDYAQAQNDLAIRRAAYYRDALPIATQRGDLSEIDRQWQKIQPSIWDNPVLAPWIKSAQQQ